MSIVRSSLFALPLVLLAACQQTRFESLPSGDPSDCDPAWVGSWRIDSRATADQPDEGPIYWIVEKDCARYQSFDGDSAEPEDEDDQTIRYLQHARQRYLVLTQRGDSKADDEAWRKAHMLVRYEFKGRDEIRTYDIDNRQVAQWILDGEIAGRSEIKSKPDRSGGTKIDSIDNLIYGPTAATDAVLQRKALFRRKPWMVLHRLSDEEVSRLRRQMENRRNPEGG